MFHKGRSKLFEIEKDTNFANRILALSMPSALVFIMLVALKLLPAGIAVMAYASIILFNIVWLFPITFELQQIRKYTDAGSFRQSGRRPRRSSGGC